MIRINRLIKKSAICEVLKLPYVAKIELIRNKSNQKDPSVIRIFIYLTRQQNGQESSEFNEIMKSLLNIPNISNETYCILKSAIQNGFIKESIYNKLGVPMDKKYADLCQRYNQAFFDTF